jgi:hypothetical protein
MRIERSVTTVSWIPSDLMEGMGKMATHMKLAHHDQPPPDRLGSDVAAELEALREGDRFRFANHLRAYIDVDDSGTITGSGYTGRGMIGATTVGWGVGSITIPAVKLPDRLADPQPLPDGGVRFTQTVGGRTGAPMPRAVNHPPFVQYHAPTVWTTLQLTIRPDGSHTSEMTGASGFPRHWVFDDAGALIAKSSIAEYKQWMNKSFGRHTPWGDEDSQALVTQVETLLERELHETIMRGSRKPEIRTIKRGRALLEQGDPDDGELYMLLNGVLAVEVDGEPVAEIGPGAVFGERAAVDGGWRRTATLRAVTDCKFAATPIAGIDFDRLDRLAGEHRREEARAPSALGAD